MACSCLFTILNSLFFVYDFSHGSLNGNGATGTKTAAEDSSLHMGDTYYYCSEEKSAFDCDWDYKR